MRREVIFVFELCECVRSRFVWRIQLYWICDHVRDRVPRTYLFYLASFYAIWIIITAVWIW
jgi:hypothetical protein